MSNFIVEVREVERVVQHPNAERLDLVYLVGLGFQFVTQRGFYSAGGKVVYFPIDAVLPDELAARLDLPKPRIRTIRLRGAFSEGFLASLSSIGLDPKLAYVGQDLTESLGVVKYEPPYNGGSNQRFSRPDELYSIPVYVYDLENAQRYPTVVELLQDKMVVATEKVEGSNWWARLSKDNLLNQEGRDQLLEVGQRRFGIKDTVGTTHPWWKQLYRQNLDTFLYSLSREYPGYDITIRGEMIGEGVQGNYYNLKGHKVLLFEIELNGTPVDAVTFFGLTNRFQVETVPTVFVGYMKDLATTAVALTAASNGNSALIEPGEPMKLREGIVVRPLEKELRDYELGRVIIKARDPIYLAQ